MSEEEKEKESGRMTRREFLKDAGFIVGGAAIGSTALLAVCGPKEEVITKTVTVKVPDPTKTVTIEKTVEVPEKLTKLTVNGETHELKVEPNWTLNFVLREKLKLTGVKIWCEEGACGVCTVLMNGVPIFSCMTLATECEGRNIETIEGLSDGVTLHPIQQAFIENFGFQCGYCTPGMILITRALLSENPNPTEEDVREALAGNICKCGDYKQIIASVLAAAAKWNRME